MAGERNSTFVPIGTKGGGSYSWRDLAFDHRRSRLGGLACQSSIHPTKFVLPGISWQFLDNFLIFHKFCLFMCRLVNWKLVCKYVFPGFVYRRAGTSHVNAWWNSAIITWLLEGILFNLRPSGARVQILLQGPQINNMTRQKSCYYHYHQYTRTNNYETHINLVKDTVH